MNITNKIRMFKGAPLSSNCYLIIDKPIFLVDTGDGTVNEKLFEFIKRYIKPSELKYIVNTHFHFDHTGGNNFIMNKTGARNFENCEKIGSFEVIQTPGHTKEDICLYNKETKTLISGDTVFGSGSVGRTDLGGDIDELKKSVEKLAELDVEIILPGHGNPVLENGNEIIKKALNLVESIS